MTGKIVHFNVRSAYSIGESTNTIPGLVRRARELGMKALALADTGSIAGVYEFYTECLSCDRAAYGNLPPIKPILGLATLVSFRGANHRAMLFAKNAAGYVNLMRVSSECALKERPFVRAIPLKTVERLHGGLVCLVVGENAELVNRLLEIFGDDFALAADSDTYDYSAWPSVPVCATPPVLFADENGAEAREVLWDCLDKGGEGENVRPTLPGGYPLLSSGETAALFRNHPKWVSATVALAERFEAYPLEKPVATPIFPLPKRFAKPSDYLRDLVFSGARKRWGRTLPTEVAERLEWELGAIAEADRGRGREDVASYFLIVRDYVEAAREMGIRAVADRGSTAGSAVAYALGLSSLDPIAHGLLFERFFRFGSSFPVMIDVDFSVRARDGAHFLDKVLDHLRRKYGAGHVARISTYGRPLGSPVIVNAARRAGLPRERALELRGRILYTHFKTLRQSIEFIRKLRQVLEKDQGPEGRTMRIAAECGDCYASIGTNVCGVVLSRENLDDVQPLFRDSASGIPQTQFSARLIEKTGLLNVNMLGLAALTRQSRCAELVREAHGIEVDFDKIPLDDKEALGVFARGDTYDIFQFDSSEMRKWLRKLKPASLSEVAVMNALFRPGLLETIPDFIRGKKGRRKAAALHPLMEPILAETYGIIVWQEQVMELSRSLAGFTPEQSGALRLALGRRATSAMAEFKRKFVAGCLANPEFRIGQWTKKGVAHDTAEAIWKKMDGMSAYAFNKSHAYGYALMAYKSAYLKAHWPEEFAAADDCLKA